MKVQWQVIPYTSTLKPFRVDNDIVRALVVAKKLTRGLLVVRAAL